MSDSPQRHQWLDEACLELEYSELLMGMLSEIRSPLSFVEGFSRLIRHELDLDSNSEELHMLVDKLIVSVDKLNEFVAAYSECAHKKSGESTE